MGKKQIKGGQPLTKEAAIAAWGASCLTNRPVIQPHEVEEVESDFQTAAACGMDDDEAASYVKQQLVTRRLRDTIAHRAIEAAHSERSRNGAAVVNADHVELHPQYQVEVDKLMQYGDSAGMRYEVAYRAVADRLGVGATTVRNHTTNKWPRKGGRPKKT